MLQNSFEIKTEVFEGPLDLLLKLIEKRKLLINDISLAKVTDDYVLHIKEQGEMSIKKNSHFILVASTLLLIKSRSLLPTLKLSVEEETSIEDLQKRLKIHQRLKKVEPKIDDAFLNSPSFFKRQVVKKDVVFAPSEQIKLSLMREIIKQIINALPKIEKTAKVIVDKVINLEDMVSRLTDRIKQGINMSFREFAGVGKTERVNVIISFLAMLELVKGGIIETKQSNHFEDIEMQTREFNTPNYS